MKFLVALLCALAAANAKSFTEDQHLVLKGGNPIDNLVQEALEYVRKLMQTHEPFSVGDIPTQKIQDNNPPVDLTVTLTNVKVSNSSNFKVNYINNNLVGLWARFGVSEPQAHATGDYDISGTALGKTVSGKGTFVNDAFDVDVNGYFEIDIVDHSVQMKNMQLNYTVENLKFEIQGLEVEGMTSQQLNNLFTTQMLSFFQQDQALISQKISKFVMEEANKICQGKTLQQLIQWLKNWIHQ